jgi:hypothetical protein
MSTSNYETLKSETPHDETPHDETLIQLTRNNTKEQSLEKDKGYYKTTNKCRSRDESSGGRYIYSVFHSIMSLVAIYLSFRCNKGFNIGSFIIACCCPWVYIIYVLATQGTCGIIQNNNLN